jgi:acetolactate synthase-1/2/3 large subunit
MLIISPDTFTYGEDPTKDPGPEWGTFLIDDYGPARHAEKFTKVIF